MTGITGPIVTVVSGMVELLKTDDGISVLTAPSTERDAGVGALTITELAKALELVLPAAVLGLIVIELVPGIGRPNGTVVSRTVELRRTYEGDPVLTSSSIELDVKSRGLTVTVASRMETLLETDELEEAF